MAIVVFQFVFFAGVIVVAGTLLSRYADMIAEVTGIGRIVVGSVLLAGATSLPELSVDIACVRMGSPDIAVGDLLGSSLMNLLILAGLDLVHKSRGQMFSRAAAGHALGGVVTIALTAIVATSLFASRRLGHHEWLGLGAGTWLILIAYALSVRLLFLDQRMAVRAAAEHGVHEASEKTEPSIWKALALFFVFAMILLLVGPRLSVVTEELANRAGLAHSFVGTTLVALSTSLPELVSCWAAIRMKAFDLVIGNIFGSNAFNMAIFGALDVVHPGALFASVSESHVITANAAMLATSVTIMGQLYQVERRRYFVEPDGLAVVAIVLGSFWMIYSIAT